MKIEVVLAILGALFAAVFAITVPLEYYRLSGVLLAFLGFLLWATAVIASDKRCEPTLSALSEESYRPLYRRLMRRVVGGALWLFGQERLDEDTRNFSQLVRDTATYRLLDRAMLFAVAYPLLLLVLFWGITGRDGSIGDVVVFAADPESWKRYVTLGGIVIVVGLTILDRRAAASPKRFLRSVSGLIAPAGAVGLVLLLAQLDLGAFAVAFAVEKLLETEQPAQAAMVAVLAPFLAICLSIGFLPWENVSSESRSLFLFLAVLPLTNALFDALSYGVTLVLTQVGLRGWALLCAFLDIIAALLLFLLLGAALVVIVAGMRQGAGVAFVDLGGLLAQAGDWRNYWWLYAMLFSTAVPTMIHLVIASFSLQALVPSGARNWICKEIREAREGDIVSGLVATLSLGTLWFLSLALPLVMLTGLIWASWMHGLESAALFYRDWLLSVAVWMEGI